MCYTLKYYGQGCVIMRFCSFASGSSGNCEYVSDGSSNILLDAGISTKRIVESLSEAGTKPEELDGIFITHEHSDHIMGLNVFESRYKVPVYATEETLEGIERADKKGRIDTSLFRPVTPDKKISIGDMEITPSSISHDAGNPVCYTITSGDEKIGMATDLGVFDDYTIDNLKDSDILFIEANYDLAMLQAGRYPFSLKKRILGNKGHLSNDMSANLILSLLGRKVKHVFLGHLSKDNNYPELAYETVKYELNKEYGDISRFNLTPAARDIMSCMVNI